MLQLSASLVGYVSRSELGLGLGPSALASSVGDSGLGRPLFRLSHGRPQQCSELSLKLLISRPFLFQLRLSRRQARAETFHALLKLGFSRAEDGIAACTNLIEPFRRRAEARVVLKGVL